MTKSDAQLLLAGRAALFASCSAAALLSGAPNAAAAPCSLVNPAAPCYLTGPNVSATGSLSVNGAPPANVINLSDPTSTDTWLAPPAYVSTPSATGFLHSWGTLLGFFGTASAGVGSAYNVSSAFSESVVINNTTSNPFRAILSAWISPGSVETTAAAGQNTVADFQIDISVNGSSAAHTEVRREANDGVISDITGIAGSPINLALVSTANGYAWGWQNVIVDLGIVGPSGSALFSYTMSSLATNEILAPTLVPQTVQVCAVTGSETVDLGYGSVVTQPTVACHDETQLVPAVPSPGSSRANGGDPFDFSQPLAFDDVNLPNVDQTPSPPNGGFFDLSVEPVAVPAPSSLLAFVAGLAGLGAALRRRRRTRPETTPG